MLTEISRSSWRTVGEPLESRWRAVREPLDGGAGGHLQAAELPAEAAAVYNGSLTALRAAGGSCCSSDRRKLLQRLLPSAVCRRAGVRCAGV